MSESRPQGTVTFLFTDIEGSTELLKQLGYHYAEVVAEHRRILRDEFGARGGTEVDTQGDAFFYSFGRARDAVAGAVRRPAPDSPATPGRTACRCAFA